MYVMFQQLADETGARPWPVIIGETDSAVELVSGRPDANLCVGFTASTDQLVDDSMILAADVVDGSVNLAELVGRFPVFTSEDGMWQDTRPISTARPYEASEGGLERLRVLEQQYRDALNPQRPWTVIGYRDLGDNPEVLSVQEGETKPAFLNGDAEVQVFVCSVTARTPSAAVDAAWALANEYDPDVTDSGSDSHGTITYRL